MVQEIMTDNSNIEGVLLVITFKICRTHWHCLFSAFWLN